MEEKVEKKEQSTVTEMIATFNRGWETVVELVVRLTGLGKAAARNAILVAIVPLLTAAVQIINWAYLYVHYHLGYNVPVAYLTVDTSWLVSFGIGVLIVAVLFICEVYLCTHPSGVSLLASIFLLVLYYAIGTDGVGLGRILVNCGILFLFCFILFGVVIDIGASVLKSGFLTSVVTVLLDAFVIFTIYQWWSRLRIIDSLSVRLFYLADGCIYFWFVLVDCKEQKRGIICLQVCMLLATTLLCFFVWDDYSSRLEPYALTADSQQAVVYQSKDVSVLEPAAIEVDDETGNVTLIINTTQQQIVDSTSLSYEYQSFDTVIIE